MNRTDLVRSDSIHHHSWGYSTAFPYSVSHKNWSSFFFCWESKILASSLAKRATYGVNILKAQKIPLLIINCKKSSINILWGSSYYWLTRGYMLKPCGTTFILCFILYWWVNLLAILVRRVPWSALSWLTTTRVF